MKYEIITTNIFDKWLRSLSTTVQARIIKRLDYVEAGSFGDHKKIDHELSELRFFFGSGYRVYYIVRGQEIVILTNGGDKSTQQKDIRKAKTIVKQLE